MPDVNNRGISLIGVPLQWGADCPGVELGPLALRSSKIQSKLESLGYQVRDLGDVPVSRQQGTQGPVEKLKYLSEIVRVNGEIARLVSGVISEGRLPLVMGGDHSLAIGTVKGVLQHLRKPGVIWFDAHADVNTEETTLSGNIHGMPLAVLLGHGHPSLVSVGGAHLRLNPGKVAIIGARCLDAGERAFLKTKGIRVFTMHEIDRFGMRAVMEEALDRVTAGTDGIHLSLDLDGLDPGEAPGVGTPVRGGLSYRESHLAMEMLHETGALVSAEVVEVNPALDQHNKTARTAVELIGSAFGSVLPEKHVADAAGKEAVPMQSSMDIVRQAERFGARNYHPLPIVVARAEGVWAWDPEGNRYLDMLSAYSALNFGHRHPKIISALKDQADKATLASRAFHSDNLGAFYEKLAGLTGKSRILPMNTGAEAVETAIKAIRRWAYRVKNIPADQAEIIVCEGNFHGRTITVTSFSSSPEYRDGFGPFTPGFRIVPYGDLEALRAAITPNTAAFLVEPIQGEAGIVIPPEGYLKAAHALCRENRVLLAADEIQTGFGRTGRTFACDWEDVKPDLYVVGKALGGGVFPISAVAADDEILGLFEPGSHGSTFGGNPLGCAVAIAAMEVLEEEKLADRAAALGAYLQEELRKIRHPAVKEIRGRGLFIGMELTEPARPWCERLMELGVLCKETHETTIRFAPPLIIGKEQLDWAVDRIRAVFEEGSRSG